MSHKRWLSGPEAKQSRNREVGFLFGKVVDVDVARRARQRIDPEPSLAKLMHKLIQVGEQECDRAGELLVRLRCLSGIPTEPESAVLLGASTSTTFRSVEMLT